MRPRILAIIFGVLLLCSHGALGYSRSDHGILNATSGVIVLDVRSSGEHISNFKLPPGDSFVFNGAFLRLKVRLHSGKILSFDSAQLRSFMAEQRLQKSIGSVTLQVFATSRCAIT
jgi:hypothetical protein